VPRVFNPLPPDHPSVGSMCPVCRGTIKAGDLTSLIVVARGGPQTTRPALAHVACARTYAGWLFSAMNN
jgi:hypothetical protein